MNGPPRRAAPLAPDARRASIVAAAIPLLSVHGRAVTTAQIAAAANVAEGTLFRVFADKDSLIAAAVEAAFDPTPSIEALERLDEAQPLRPFLVAAVEILQRRVESIWQLVSMLGPPPDHSHRREKAPSDPVVAALAVKLEPHRGELRCKPAQAAHLIGMLAFAGTHPRISGGTRLDAREIVATILDGIVRRETC